MSEPLPLPSVGKLVTLIAVSNGEPVVTFGEVLVSKSNIVAIAANTDKIGLERLKDSPATIIYGGADNDMVLRGRVSEVVAPDRVLISTPAPPRPGERREYIRTDMTLGVRMENIPANSQEPEAMREWMEQLPLTAESLSFKSIEVDLSGSGARFTIDCGVKKKEQVCVSFLLEKEQPRPVLHLAASVVRSRPAKDGSSQCEVALTFSAMPEADRDLLNYVVFESRARQLGVSAVHLLEDD